MVRTHAYEIPILVYVGLTRTADAALTERWSNVGKWEALAALNIAVLALHATGGIRARSGVWCLRGDGGHEREDGEEDATHGCWFEWGFW